MTAVPLAVHEVMAAATSLPIGFTTDGDHYRLAAILGLRSGENLFLNSDGSWAGTYIPASLLSFPFALYPQGQREVLCIDEQSGLISEQLDGELFFDDAGGLAPLIANLAHFLQSFMASMRATVRICNLLAERGLIAPWPLVIQGLSEDQQLKGLYCINEAALSKLSDVAFIELRSEAALPLIYGQLMSMANMQRLGDIASLKWKVAQGPSTSSELPRELDLEFLNNLRSIDR